MRRSLRRKAAVPAVLLTLGLAAAACGGGSGSSMSNEMSAKTESASQSANPSASPAMPSGSKLRVAHLYSSDAAPAPAAVDVYVTPQMAKPGVDKPAVPSLTFGTVTPYLDVPAGTYDVSVYLAGSDKLVKSFPGTKVPEGGQLTAVAERASTSSQDFTINFIDEKALPMPEAGKAAVTAYHGVPLPAADGVRVGAEGAGCLANGAQLNLAQKATVQVPAGAYQIGVFGSGDATCAGKALIGPANAQVEAGKSYLVFAVGTTPEQLGLKAAPIGA